MVSVAVSHVIGTVALIGLFITASMSYSMHFSTLKEEAARAQLQSIADHVSAVILDLHTVGSSVQGSQTLVKTLGIPADVAQSSYNLTLIRVVSPSGEETLSVLVRLTWKPATYAESRLPFNSLNLLQLFNGTSPQGLGTTVEPRQFVLSGVSAPAIWYCRAGNSAIFGLGVRS